MGDQLVLPPPSMVFSWMGFFEMMKLFQESKIRMRKVVAGLLPFLSAIYGEGSIRDNKKEVVTLIHNEDDFRAPDFDFSRLKVSQNEMHNSKIDLLFSILIFLSVTFTLFATIMFALMLRYHLLCCRCFTRAWQRYPIVQRNAST